MRADFQEPRERVLAVCVAGMAAIEVAANFLVRQSRTSWQKQAPANHEESVTAVGRSLVIGADSPDPLRTPKGPRVPWALAGSHS
jgi:hypothetical protein